MVPKRANHIFWQTVRAGAIQAGIQFGYEIEWNGQTMEIDSSRQIEIVDSMINKRFSLSIPESTRRSA